MTQTTLPARSNARPAVRFLKDHRDVLEGEGLTKALAAALPKHIEPGRIVKAAISAVNKNPMLLECTRDSFLLALMSCAECGLLPNTALDEAYIIPYRNSKGGIKEAQFQAGYKGLLKLLHNTGEIAGVDTQIVYKGEVFEYRRGTDPHINHVPDYEIDRSEKNIVGAYCVIWLKGEGLKPVIEYMPLADLLKVRDKSKSPNSPAYQDFAAEMYRKAVFRRASKWVPRSNERHETFANAIAFDAGDINPRLSIDSSYVNALGIEADEEPTQNEQIGDDLANKAAKVQAGKTEPEEKPMKKRYLLGEVQDLEAKANLGNKTVDFRTEYAGYADLAKADDEGLKNYRAFLVDRIDTAERETAESKKAPEAGKAGF